MVIVRSFAPVPVDQFVIDPVVPAGRCPVLSKVIVPVAGVAGGIWFPALSWATQFHCPTAVLVKTIWIVWGFPKES